MNRRGQSALEYLLLLGVVVALVLVALRTNTIRAYDASQIFFNKTSSQIMGSPNPCGDGYCHPRFEDCEKCPTDCPMCPTKATPLP